MMSRPDSAALRADINRTTDRMTACANLGDWEETVKLVDQRSRLIQMLLSDPDRITLEEVALIRETLELDRSLLRLAKTSRAEVAEKLKTLRKGTVATQAYTEHA